MALTATNKGAGSNASTATTLAFSPASGPFTAGALILLAIACDNARSGGVAFTTFTCSDNAGGVTTPWSMVYGQALYDPAGTSAGINGTVFSRPVTAPQLLATSTITVTWDTAVTAKAWTLTEITSSVGGVPTIIDRSVQGAGVYDPLLPPDINAGSVNSGDLAFFAAFSENTTSSTSAPWVGDVDSTNGSWGGINTLWSGGASTSHVGVGTQWKITTGTGSQHWNPTVAAGGTPDCSFMYIVVNEVAVRASVAWVQLRLPVAFLSTAAATGSTGLLTPGGSLALTGVAATGSITPNTLLGGGGATRAYVAWAELVLPEFVGDELTLSQQAGVGEVGDLTPLTGNTRAFVAWAGLVLPSSNDVVLTGVAAAGIANNTLTPIKDAVVLQLTGVAAEGTAGDLDEAQYTQLTQKAAVGSIGLLSPADLNYGYIGELTPTQSVVLSQAAAVGSLGPVGIEGDPDSQAPLTHTAAVGSAGQLVPGQTVALLGKQATGFTGPLGTSIDYTVELTQAAAVGSTGVLSEEFSNPVYEFLGQVAAVGSAGVLGTPENAVVLTGVSAYGLIGTFPGLPDSWTPVPPDGGIWVPVNDNATEWTEA